METSAEPFDRVGARAVEDARPPASKPRRRPSSYRARTGCLPPESDEGLSPGRRSPPARAARSVRGRAPEVHRRSATRRSAPRCLRRRRPRVRRRRQRARAPERSGPPGVSARPPRQRWAVAPSADAEAPRTDPGRRQSDTRPRTRRKKSKRPPVSVPRRPGRTGGALRTAPQTRSEAASTTNGPSERSRPVSTDARATVRQRSS